MHWSNETCALVMAKKVDALEAKIDQGFVSVQERHEEAMESLSAEVGEALDDAALRARTDCQVLVTNYRRNGQIFKNLLSYRPVFGSDGAFKFVVAAGGVSARNKSPPFRLLPLFVVTSPSEDVCF